jgi:hypothetical protein
MTVNITISETSAGYSIADSIDLGDYTPGDSDVSFQDLFISHDATVSSITDCSLYLTRYTGSSYPGLDADADLVQILGWGDGTNTEGVLMSMTPNDPWVIGEEFEASTWESFYVGHGDVDTQITLDHLSLVHELTVTDGEIPVGNEAHIQMKLVVPSSPGTAGAKGFGLVFSFSATS